MSLPRPRYLRLLQVPQVFDGADSRITAGVRASDLVINADLPLTAQVVEAGATALNPCADFSRPTATAW